MQAEAEITVNGTKLTGNESMVVRVALATFADILAEGLGFKDDGITANGPISGRYSSRPDID
jgi:hypothetical protein